MRRTLVPFLFLFASGVAVAAESDSHSVTVNVEAINEVTVSGDVTLTIDSATAGSEPDAASSSSVQIDWTTNEVGRKITVATDLADPTFALTVEAAGVTGGTTAGVVALTTTPKDFVTGISETTGFATLAYETTALAADGTGQDVHIVTYTITGT